MNESIAPGNSSVVVISKCDGTPSNTAILIGGTNKGATVVRQENGPNTVSNACPTMLRYIEHGDVPAPLCFPHRECDPPGNDPKAA